MSKPWLLVSPASRGIGLQLARRLLKITDLPVIATARRDLETTSEQILDGLDVDEQRLEVLKLDVTGTISPTFQPTSNFPLTCFHQMKAPSRKRQPTANLVSRPATSASPSASLASFIPRSPHPKSNTSTPSPRSRSIPLGPFSSQNTSRPFYQKTGPSNPFPTSLLPLSLP